MNKAETARQFTRQTVEQERDLEAQRKKDLQEIKDGIRALMNLSQIMIQNQSKIANYQQRHLPDIILIKKQIKGMEAMRKAQRRIQVIWIITFLTITIPFSASSRLG